MREDLGDIFDHFVYSLDFYVYYFYNFKYLYNFKHSANYFLAV